MCERIKSIKEYYINLRYDESNKEEALMEISKLSKKIKSDNGNSFSEKFLKTASLIKKNMSLFQSACKHIDIVTTFIECLNNFGAKFMFGNLDTLDEEREEIMSMMYTFYNLCKEDKIQLFFTDAIIGNTKIPYDLHDKLLNQLNEMIVLEDSDLYAVISHLMIVENHYLNKIWVQQPIRLKFLSLINKYCKHWDFPIHVFRSKQELLTYNKNNKIYIISIWSEDIIAAKNLAASLNGDVLFINTHMDFCGGVVLLPCLKKLYHRCFILHEDDKCVNTIKPNTYEGLIYNLFYDGMWQKPVKNTYWIHKDTLWANATSGDIKRCIDSAKEGTRIWGAKSINSRIQVLSKFASTLECNGKFQLADIVSKWIKFPYLNETSLLCSLDGRLEVTTIHMPAGITILKAEQEITLFQRLIQALITGNSVIVICNAMFCTLVPYCDMFSTSGIPPGVINMLSRENIQDILNESLYCAYEEQLFEEGKPEKIYLNLTMPKKIILPLK